MIRDGCRNELSTHEETRCFNSTEQLNPLSGGGFGGASAGWNAGH